MRLASQYVVMFFWSAVCVRPQDPPSLNSSSDANATSPPCFLQIGDVPYTKCNLDPGRDEIFNSSKENSTTPMSSNVVTESDPTTVFTTVINPMSTTMESSTTAPKPATITPTVHPSPNSPDETKFTTKTPAQSSMMIVGETVHKNHEAGRNATEPTNCTFVWMGLDTEVYLLVVCSVQMVIMATLSFCLYKQCKKQPVENLHLTRLISIPNPAFSNP